MTTRARPLRTTLLATAAFLLALVLLLDRSYQAAVVDAKRIEAEAMAAMHERLYALQIDLSGRLLAGELANLAMTINTHGSFRNVRHILVADAAGMVLHSTRRADIGRPYALVIEGLDRVAASRALQQRRIEVKLDDTGDIVAGYAPLTLPPRAGEVRALDAGLLYYAADIGSSKRAPWRQLVSAENLARWLGALTLMLLALAALLEIVLFRPLRRLQLAAERFAAGDWRARSELTGRGEIAALAATFDRMAQQIEEDRAELLALNTDLEQRVAKRTNELEASNRRLLGTQRALTDAAATAQAANDAKSRFLANMSHELRTPLNAILGFAQLMARDTTLAAEHRRRLDIINRSGQHLLGLINDVLEISRIEAGRAEVRREACELAQLFQSLAEMARMRAEAKGLALHLHLAPELPAYVVTDAAKLRQIVLNLLTNAIKYTEHGEIRVSVTCEDDDGTTILRCAVADTGIGIEPAALDHIFDAFYQADAGARKGEGTGLGLAICHQYAGLLGGSITVDSTPGLGSLFQLRIPVEVATALPATAPPHPRIERLAPGQPAFDVLVVEDNPANRELLRTLLEQAGFAVRVAENGEEALRAFGEARPNFIWMDMRMPVMDGFEATRRLRALPGGADVPIVALTASAFEEDRARILAVGCNDVVTKPLDEERIFDTLARHLGAVYQYTVIPAEERPPTPPAAPPALGHLPDALRRRLFEAARILDGTALRALAAEARNHDAAAAAWLNTLIEDYRFDEIARALEAAAP